MSLRSPILLGLFSLIALLGGCAQSPVDSQSNPAPVVGRADNSHWIITELYRQYQQYRGTPYRYGGNDQRGLDCSGLVKLTFAERFDRSLPRTTLQQSQLGRGVAKDQLQPGDLVFFKTGEKLRHVGIYIEDGQFLHVSTKKGVMISRLTDYYWKDRYQYARRIRW